MTAPPSLDDPRMWVRVVRELLEQVGRGELKPGGTVPSMDTMSAALGSGRGAASRAVGYLASHHVVTLGPGRRYMVTDDAPERAAALAEAMRRAAPAPASLERVTGPQQLAWTRVVNLILDRIGSGEYSGRMPVIGALVAETGTSRRTVGKALAYLAERGVVYRVPAHGWYVVPRAAAAPRREVTHQEREEARP